MPVSLGRGKRRGIGFDNGERDERATMVASEIKPRRFKSQI
jgi:hypothetical protein